MMRIKQLQLQNLKLQVQLLMLLLLLPAIAVARPQQQLLLDGLQVEQVGTAPAPALNDLSDLSVGINLFPVSNLIAAAANSEPPAPIQFVRVAMNSGL